MITSSSGILVVPGLCNIAEKAKPSDAPQRCRTLPVAWYLESLMYWGTQIWPSCEASSDAKRSTATWERKERTQHGEAALLVLRGGSVI